MARPPDKAVQHTKASIAHVASELHSMGTRLEAALTILGNDIDTLNVRYETSLKDGLAFMDNWVNEVTRCVRDAKLEHARKPIQNGRVRKTGHVSDAGSK